MADVLLASMQKTGVKTLSIIDTISELATDKTEASRLTLPSPVIRVSSSTPGTPHAQNKSKQTLLLTGGVKPGGQPGVPPRNPKVSVPFYSPNVSSLLSTSTTKSNNNTTTPHQSPAATQDNSILGGSVHVRSKSLFNGAKPRFFATSSPKNSPSATTPATATAVSSAKHLNLSAISRHQSSNNGHHLPPPHPASSSFVQTPKSVTNASTTSTSRGQTPDWIRDIFLQAKRGNREKLVSLSDEDNRSTVRLKSTFFFLKFFELSSSDGAAWKQNKLFQKIYVLHYFWPTMDLPTLLKKYPRESQHSTRLFEKILKKYIDRRCRSLIWIF